MNPLLLTTEDEHPVLRLDLDQATATMSRETFLGSAEEFEQNIDEYIAFDPGYQLQDGECFQIDEFELSADLYAACSQPLASERVSADNFNELPVKAIAGYDFTNGGERVFFQNFDSRRILIPGRKLAVWPMADASTFSQMQRPVLLLDAKLAAIWENRVLKFKSFHLAKQIFDLSAYFDAATDEQVENFCTHASMMCADTHNFVRSCNQWTRKKIALILRGGVLEDFTTENLMEVGRALDYSVPLEGDRIVLPTNNRELKSLLQFLDEDVYRGPFSQRRLLSSGKRELG